MTQLRPIDIGDRPVIDPDDVRAGAVPELRWLDIDNLRVDDAFQRPLGKSNWLAIEKIARNFNWSMFTPVVAAPIVGGLYSLIDGQHRTHGAKLAGFDQVPAMVVMTAEAGQAAAFAAINGAVIRMNSFNIYKAALAANIGWATRCRDVVDAGGCRLMTYNPGSTIKPRMITCPMEIKRHIQSGRAEVVTAVLGALSSQQGLTVEHFSTATLNPFIYAAAAIGGDLSRIDLVAFAQEHDVAAIARKMIVISKQPDYAGQSARELTKKAIAALLRRRLPANGSAVVFAGEDAIAARMATVAAGERRAQRTIT